MIIILIRKKEKLVILITGLSTGKIFTRYGKSRLRWSVDLIICYMLIRIEVVMKKIFFLILTLLFLFTEDVFSQNNKCLEDISSFQVNISLSIDLV